VTCSIFSSVRSKEDSLTRFPAEEETAAGICSIWGWCFFFSTAPLLLELLELFRDPAFPPPPPPSLIGLDVDESSVPASLIFDESERALNDDGPPLPGALATPEFLLEEL